MSTHPLQSGEPAPSSYRTQRPRRRASELNKEWGINADHALYNGPGTWYHYLRSFPGALLDKSGYVIFETEEEYRNTEGLAFGQDVHVRNPGISSLPAYKLAPSTSTVLQAPDVDIHDAIGIEGQQRLVLHLRRERDRTLVERKKKSVRELTCEVCKFSFAQAYGFKAKDYCEVHHLAPLSTTVGARRTKLSDLAILCANCHRVVHLKYPPHTLNEVREMLDGQRSWSSSAAS